MRRELTPTSVFRRGRRSLRLALTVLLGVGLALAPTLDAQAKKSEEKKEERDNFAAGEWAFKKLTAAHEALAEERYAEARGFLDQMSKRKGLNKHEQALMWQTYGYIEFSQEQYKPAAASFEKCLALDALPKAAALGTQYNLGQLYMTLERYKEAVKTLESWIGQVKNPAASSYYLVSMAHVQTENAKAALPYARKAVDRAKKPRESYLQLVLALEFELKNFKRVANVLELLISHFPKKSYFMQLSAVYGELGQDKRVLATLELAYIQGLLDRESELLNLAQAYLFHNIPYRAAQVIEKGLADKIVSEDAEHWKLLGDSWLHAREFDAALDPLQRAAALSGEGNLYVRIAQVHVERDESAQALAALEKGIAKGGLDNPGNAYLLLGITHAGAKRYGPARNAFAKAGDYEKSRKAAASWIKHVEHQEALQ